MTSTPTPVKPLDDDEIDLGRVFAALSDGRWRIAAIAIATLFAGFAYTLLAKPVYEANLLLQVEDSTPGGGKGMLAEAAAMFDVKTEAAAEIEIIKSRMVVGKPVDELRLHIDARPARVPVIGRAIAAHNPSLSTPGLLGLGHSTWGAESISVQRFDLPASLYERPFTLIAQDNGQYTLNDPATGLQHSGKVGQLLRQPTLGGHIELLVQALEGQPGAGFSLRRSTRLSSIEDLQQQLNVSELGKRSGMIDVRLRGNDAQQVVDILNTIGNEYVRQNLDRKSEEADKSLHFLDQQLPLLKKELEQAEARYNQFRNQRGVVDLGEEAKALLGLAVQAQTRAAELRHKRLEAVARYTTQHPSVQALDAQIKQAAGELEQINGQIKRLPLLEQDMLRLTRDMKVSTDLYANLLATIQQLRLVKAGKVGTVRLIDTAVLPNQAIQPQRGQILAVALVLGLLLGCTTVLVRRAMRNAVEAPEDIESATGLSVYATVPYTPGQTDIDKQLQTTHRAQLLAKSQSDDFAIESLRGFMTALQFAMVGASSNVVLITGGTPNVGKSFISANFAAVLANSGQRVLLIDGDLRKGYLHEYFGTPRQRGLSELLAGSATLTHAVRAAALPGLDFVPTGEQPPNPAELLRTPRLAQLLQEVAPQYDLVLIDTAPVLPVPDTAILAPHAGATIMVVRDGHSTTPEVRDALKQLAQVGVRATCAIFNGMRPRRGRYGYGYSYGYGQSEYAPRPTRRHWLRSFLARLGIARKG